MAGLLLLALTFACGLPVLIVGLLGSTRRLPRSRWLGLPNVLGVDNDEAWTEAHVSGGAVLLFGGVATVVTGLAFAPFALFGALPGAVSLAAIAAQAALLIGTVVVASAVGATRVSRVTAAGRR